MDGSSGFDVAEDEGIGRERYMKGSNFAEENPQSRHVTVDLCRLRNSSEWQGEARGRADAMTK